MLKRIERISDLNSFVNIESSRDELEVDLGRLNIRIATAKKPHEPWNSRLKSLVLDSRRSYWSGWGEIPLEDDLDRSSYVDIARLSYPDPRKPGLTVAEGLTMRTVLINGEQFENIDRLPDDLRFFVDSNGDGLLKLIAQKFYNSDLNMARDRVVAASRVAPIRPQGSSCNFFTPEVFAAIQVKAALRAQQHGVDFFVNTMRPEMEEKVLSLEGGTSYSHILSETTLGLQKGSIKLNREDPFVLDHIFNYPGYFLNVSDLVGLIKLLIADRKLLPSQIEELGVDPNNLDDTRPTEIRKLQPLIRMHGDISPSLTGDDLRRLIVEEVGDGTFSYTMTTEERLNAGIKLLEESTRILLGKEK